MELKLESYIAHYKNAESENNTLHKQFTEATDDIEFLKKHRDYIEQNKLGFGDRAFHYMWFLIMKHLSTVSKSPLNVLEIGVYKGQVISLWSLLSKELDTQILISAITPLVGEKKPNFSFLTSLKYRLSKKFKERVDNADFYEDEDYLEIIKELFSTFDLNADDLVLYKGFSTDDEIVSSIQKNEYHLIYIDGDHTFDGVKHDINHYAPLIVENGFLVMDDASCNIPGSTFWKGHQAVSDACEIIESMDFDNVLNIGHNRIFRKRTIS